MQDPARWKRNLRGPIRLIRLTAFFLVVGLAACGGRSFSDASVPDISLAGLSFADLSQERQDVTIQLRLKNDNEFDIPIKRLRFDLNVEGMPFVDGERGSGFLLPASSEMIIPIQISMESDKLVERVSIVGIGKGLAYRLTGVATINTWFNNPILSFDREGSLVLPELPASHKGQPPERQMSLRSNGNSLVVTF